MSGDADEPYRTVERQGRAAFSIRGSEFVGHAAPVRSVETAETFVDEVRASHSDATHNVPAYRVRTEGGLLREYASDEGEPPGSAGKPALTVLARRDLSNVAVVVSRYFGGTELGVGGLARAYGEATKLAVDDAGVVEAAPHRRLSIVVEYDDSGTVRGILESEGLTFEAEYAERVRFDVWTPEPAAAGLRDRLRSATGGRVEIDPGGDRSR